MVYGQQQIERILQTDKELKELFIALDFCVIIKIVLYSNEGSL